MFSTVDEVTGARISFAEDTVMEPPMPFSNWSNPAAQTATCSAKSSRYWCTNIKFSASRDLDSKGVQGEDYILSNKVWPIVPENREFKIYYQSKNADTSNTSPSLKGEGETPFMYFDAIDLDTLKDEANIQLKELEAWTDATFKPVEDALNFFDTDLEKWETFSSKKWGNMSTADKDSLDELKKDSTT